MTLTLYDGLMALLVVVGLMQGAWRGMVWQIAPIASLVGGYLVAFPLSISTAQYFGEPPLNRLWAMITIYLVVSLAVYLMVRSIRESFERMKLVELDRHLGALLGGVKGVLFGMVITIGLLSVSAHARDLILRSESSTITAQLMTFLSPILPEALNDLIKPYVDHLHNSLPAYASERGVRPTRKIARQDELARPRRFDDADDVLTPPSRTPTSRTRSRDSFDDDWSDSRSDAEPARRPRSDDWEEPREPSRTRPSRTLEDQARDAARGMMEDLMLPVPGRGRPPAPDVDDSAPFGPTRTRRTPSARPLPADEEDPIANDRRTPSRDRSSPPSDDDFFTADPDQPGRSSSPR